MVPGGEDGFTTHQVKKITGASIVLLDNWHRSGFLSPSIEEAPGRGITRQYGFRDLVAIRVVLDLRSSGISMQSMRKVVTYLRARKGLSATDVLASTSLITDGHDVYEVEGDVTLSTLRKPGQRGFFVLPLDELVSEVQSKARAMRAA
jgi:DNA-binding transcriptional MerR regulator